MKVAARDCLCRTLGCEDLYFSGLLSHQSGKDDMLPNQLSPKVIADLESDTPEWWGYLPVSVNCSYGDPLLHQQELDTAAKLSHLISTGHRAPFGFCTKGLLSPRAEQMFRSLPESPNLVFRYSLTGLAEANYDFDRRVDSIRRLEDIFGKEKVIISPRPIIAGRNDDEANLARIVEIAAQGSRVLILGGFHNFWKHKMLSDHVDKFLRKECETNNVSFFYKSSCSSAFVTGTACWMHDLSEPRNLDVLAQLGYSFTIENEAQYARVVLDEATTGDLNFARMITGSLPATRALISNYNLVSPSPASQDIEQTSSWFVWARNLPQCLNCDYCIINDIEYLQQERKDIGVAPTLLPETLTKRHRLFTFTKGGLAKPRPAADGRTDYTRIRIVKECRRHSYCEVVGSGR